MSEKPTDDDDAMSGIIILSACFAIGAGLIAQSLGHNDYVLGIGVSCVTFPPAFIGLGWWLRRKE